jgi:hypothetical protein
VPFKTLRPTSRIRIADQPHLSGAVVVRLPLANGGNRRQKPHALANVYKGRTEPWGTNEEHFTPFDLVATAFLILSVFAAPALVWTLLRSASVG